MNTLGISIVIPTRNRAEHVGNLLDSIDTARKAFSGESEVIVVDDSDAAETIRIREACHRHGARFVEGVPSVRRKRNLGVELSSHPVVLFIDSDCMASPDLLEVHAAAMAAAPLDVGGIVGVTEFVGADSWMWRVIQRTQFLNAFSFATRMPTAPWSTCTNVSYRRSVFTQLGGFDVTLPFRLGADDTDLGLRLNNSGWELRCEPAARVRHDRRTWDGFLRVWRRAFRWGRLDVHLYYRRHADRLAWGAPRLTQLLVLVAASTAVVAARADSALPLLLAPIWLALVFVLQAVATVVAGPGPRSVLVELAADVLGFGFELGTLCEGLLCAEPRVLYLSPRRGPVLPGFDGGEWAIQAWSAWVATLLLVVGAVLLE